MLNMMTDAEYWWNHLTVNQKEFIAKHYSLSGSLDKGQIEYAYQFKKQFHEMQDWPETAMRDLNAL